MAQPRCSVDSAVAMAEAQRSAREHRPAWSERLVVWLSRHWFSTALGILGIYIVLPWLAPIFMHLGWTRAANAIHLAYVTQCHQLPQRSFFLFGARPMYTLPEIRAAFRLTDDPLVLRQFIGAPGLGWKVAWSDRMVAMYGSLWLFGLLYALLRRRVKPLRWALGLALVAPLVLDGATHMASDWSGIGTGFRDTNAWLAFITGGRLSVSFYAGDALGSFNSWMRLLSGVLFGLGVAWHAFPRLDRMFARIRRDTARRA